MIIVNYKSKRQLKKAIGDKLKCAIDGHKGTLAISNSGSFFVENSDRTFRATVTLADGKIESVR